MRIFTVVGSPLEQARKYGGRPCYYEGKPRALARHPFLATIEAVQPPVMLVDALISDLMVAVVCVPEVLTGDAWSKKFLSLQFGFAAPYKLTGTKYKCMYVDVERLLATHPWDVRFLTDTLGAFTSILIDVWGSDQQMAKCAETLRGWHVGNMLIIPPR